MDVTTDGRRKCTSGHRFSMYNIGVSTHYLNKIRYRRCIFGNADAVFAMGEIFANTGWLNTDGCTILLVLWIRERVA